MTRVIASGPCAPDPSTWQDVLTLIALCDHHFPQVIEGYRKQPQSSNGGEGETPAGRSGVQKCENRIIATARQSLAAAAQFFQAQASPRSSSAIPSPVKHGGRQNACRHRPRNTSLQQSVPAARCTDFPAEKQLLR
ncbi:MAG: hypothetical protein P0107_01550 [Nitrosomonas sp.]|nr:hypothetical protein [Nitrosomonas sp.]